MSYRRTHKRNHLTRKNHGQPMSEQQSIGPHGAAGSKAQGPLKNIYIYTTIACHHSIVPIPNIKRHTILSATMGSLHCYFWCFFYHNTVRGPTV